MTSLWNPKEVYIAKYSTTRNTYHLKETCRRLKPATSYRSVTLDNTVLDDLRPCQTCLGVADLGSCTGNQLARKLEDMNPEEV